MNKIGRQCMSLVILLLLFNVALLIGVIIRSHIAKQKCKGGYYRDSYSRSVKSETNSFQFIVTVMVRQNQSDIFYCSGIIIKLRWVLTTGHCSELIQIYLHNAYVTNDLREFENQVIFTSIHANYNNQNFDSDIGMLYVKDNFPSGSPVEIFNGKYRTKSGFIGFGYSNEFSSDVAKPIPVTFDKIHCSGFYKNEDDKLASSMFCARLPLNFLFVCHFEVGLPLLDNQQKLVGIVSWGRDCGKINHPVVYTNISYLSKWIYAAIK